MAHLDTTFYWKNKGEFMHSKIESRAQQRKSRSMIELNKMKRVARRTEGATGLKSDVLRKYKAFVIIERKYPKITARKWEGAYARKQASLSSPLKAKHPRA